MPNMQSPSILIVDDTQAVLDALYDHLAALLANDDVDIRKWLPTAVEGEDPKDTFHSKVDDSTILVATDQDLTSKGLKGLFGHTIVGWCHNLSIPVGDFSRRTPPGLPKEPELFELKVPSTDEAGAKFMASVFLGFKGIREFLTHYYSQVNPPRQNLAGVLADLLGRPFLESQLALYMSSTNALLAQRIRNLTLGPEGGSREELKLNEISYVLGHILLNAVLKYPGPLLSRAALSAYCGTTEQESQRLHELFQGALYAGPFHEIGPFYWREEVDSIIDHLSSPLALQEFTDFGDYNRAVIERQLGGLQTHTCDREGCGGKKGGFFCPFTNRPVCQRPDCSVASSSLIPQGAQLARVERDFYDEWAPLLSF